MDISLVVISISLFNHGIYVMFLFFINVNVCDTEVVTATLKQVNNMVFFVGVVDHPNCIWCVAIAYLASLSLKSIAEILQELCFSPTRLRFWGFGQVYCSHLCSQ